MPKKLLIVDDSATMRQMVSFAVKDAGFDVIIAENGKIAISKLIQAKIDFVITDLNMPEMGGIEFIKHLRGMPQYTRTPVLMLTTESEEKQKQEGRLAGANGWIVKPFNPRQLIEEVNKLVK